MKVLHLNEKILKLAGLCLERTATRKDFFFSILSNIVITATIFFFTLISIPTFIIQKENNDITNYLFTLLQIIAIAPASLSYLCFAWNKNKTQHLFSVIQSIVDQSMHLDKIKFKGSKHFNCGFHFSPNRRI